MTIVTREMSSVSAPGTNHSDLLNQFCRAVATDLTRSSSAEQRRKRLGVLAAGRGKRATLTKEAAFRQVPVAGKLCVAQRRIETGRAVKLWYGGEKRLRVRVGRVFQHLRCVAEF